MKSKRQEKILELIAQYAIETQEELLERLSECGIPSTQATVSRDIKQLHLYKEPRGGYFATASCSHFMPSELFEKMLRSAALDAGVELRQIEARQQSPDHPILWNVPETDYLKFYLFQVV